MDGSNNGADGSFLILVEVSVSPYVFSFYERYSAVHGTVPPFLRLAGEFVFDVGGCSRNNKWLLRIPACRLLSTFAKTKNNEEAKIINLASKAFLDMRFIQITYSRIGSAHVPTLSCLHRRSPVGQSFILLQFSLHPACVDQQEQHFGPVLQF